MKTKTAWDGFRLGESQSRVGESKSDFSNGQYLLVPKLKSTMSYVYSGLYSLRMLLELLLLLSNLLY